MPRNWIKMNGFEIYVSKHATVVFTSIFTGNIYKLKSFINTSNRGRVPCSRWSEYTKYEGNFFLDREIVSKFM